MSNAVLYHADFQDTLKQAQDKGGVDLVVTSPPYCDARTYGASVNWTMADYNRLGDAIFQALKPGGHCLLNMDSPVRKWREGFGSERGFHPWKVMLDWAERVGFRVPDRLCFSRFGSPGEYSGRFRNDWEPLLWFQKPGAVGIFNKHVLAEQAKYPKIHNTSSRRHDGSLRVRYMSGWATEKGLKHRGTLWDYSAVGNGQTGAADLETSDHPARFPFRLVSDIVQCFSNPGSVVCDPFLGSGTSLIASLHHGRDFIGGDLLSRDKDNKPWVNVAAEIAEGRFGAGDLAMFGNPDLHNLTVIDQAGVAQVLLQT